MFKQRSIKQPISTMGVGLHTGKKVTLTMRPAPANTGIVYVRKMPDGRYIDFEKDNFTIEGTALCTKMVHKATKETLATVEHLNAALSAYKIDNLIIEVDNLEIPIMNGSSSPFLYMLEEAGIECQNENKSFLLLTKEVEYRIDDKFAILKPNVGFHIDFTINFDHPAIKMTKSNWSGYITERTFKNELSRARTFGFMKDIEYLQSLGMCLGGSLDNAIVLDEYKVLNPDGLVYPDEFVRHKVLDSVGDLFVSQKNMLCSLVAYKSGHELNNKVLVKALEQNAFSKFEFTNENEIKEELGWSFQRNGLFSF